MGVVPEYFPPTVWCTTSDFSRSAATSFLSSPNAQWPPRPLPAPRTRTAPASELASPAALEPRRQQEKPRSEEHTSELQSRGHLVCRLLLEKKNKNSRGQRRRTSRDR